MYEGFGIHWERASPDAVVYGAGGACSRYNKLNHVDDCDD